MDIESIINLYYNYIQKYHVAISAFRKSLRDYKSFSKYLKSDEVIEQLGGTIDLSVLLALPLSKI